MIPDGDDMILRQNAQIIRRIQLVEALEQVHELTTAESDHDTLREALQTIKAITATIKEQINDYSE